MNCGEIGTTTDLRRVCRPDEKNSIPVTLKVRWNRGVDIIHQSYNREQWCWLYAVTLSLIVKAYISAHNRNRECASRLTEPFYAVRDLPHRFWVLRTRHVEAIGDPDRSSSRGRDVSTRLSEGERGPAEGINRAESRVAIKGYRDTLFLTGC